MEVCIEIAKYYLSSFTLALISPHSYWIQIFVHNWNAKGNIHGILQVVVAMAQNAFDGQFLLIIDFQLDRKFPQLFLYIWDLWYSN